MKAALFGLGALAGLASANINFVWVQPSCELGSELGDRCLTGQHCTEANTCLPDSSSDDSKVISRSTFRVVPAKRQNGQYSTDGKCGPANGNLLCDPNSTVYTGTCCSSYGWCGNTPAHCGTGCLSGCGGAPSSTVPATNPTPGTSAPRSDGRCGKDFAGATCDVAGPYGGCCSSYG